MKVPAEEASGVIERFPRQAEAHVQRHTLWVCKEALDETGCGHRRCSTLCPWRRVTAWCGILQSWAGMTICHRLPLREAQNIGAAVHR